MIVLPAFCSRKNHSFRNYGKPDTSFLVLHGTHNNMYSLALINNTYFSVRFLCMFHFNSFIRMTLFA